MFPATDSAKNRRLSGAWPLVLLAFSLDNAGCAGMNPFRTKEERPAFGTETASLSENGKGSSSATGDLYVDRMKQGRKRPDANSTQGDSSESLLAQKRGGNERPETSPPANEVAQPLVALSTPVSLAGPASVAPQDAVPAMATANENAEKTQAPVDLAAGLTPPSHQESTLRDSAPGEDDSKLHAVLAESRKTLDHLQSYQVRMNLQERVGATLNPAEDVVLSIQRTPKAVRLEWHEGTNKGREVIYAADASGGLMHVKMANPLLPIPRISMPPDSPLATRNSRHPITEAGFDTILHNIEEGIRRERMGDPSWGQVRYLGREQPPELDRSCDKIVRTTPSQETWVVYIDPATHLPAMVQANAGNGDLLERFVFRDPIMNPPELAMADAFDPDARWGASKGGLLKRLAHASSNESLTVEKR